MECIAQDIADNDLYKFTMGQLVFNQFPNALVKYRYTNRAEDKRYRPTFAAELREQVDLMSELRLKKQMTTFFYEKTSWLKPTYLQWLESFRFKPEQVRIEQNDKGELSVEIEGPWFETIYWEVPLLFIISELAHTVPSTNAPYEKKPGWDADITNKAKRLQDAGVNWIDFGTRRRFSFEVQNRVCEIMKGFAPEFRGTSNPYLAMKHNLTPIGTFAHELPMAMQALYGLQQCNLRTMEHWVKEYHGDLGIALMDTVTTPKFLEVFDSFYARLFDGVRQDSGEPKVIGDMVLAHYKKLRIDPTTKVITFSDSLNVDKAIDLHEYFKGKIRTTMGIGTHLTNDVGYKAPNHVIKAVEANFGLGWKKLLKLPDEASKRSGDDADQQHAIRELGI